MLAFIMFFTLSWMYCLYYDWAKYMSAIIIVTDTMQVWITLYALCISLFLTHFICNNSVTDHWSAADIFWKQIRIFICKIEYSFQCFQWLTYSIFYLIVGALLPRLVRCGLQLGSLVCLGIVSVSDVYIAIR